MKLQQFAYKTTCGLWKLVPALFERKRDCKRYLDSKRTKYLSVAILNTFEIKN